MTQPVRGEVDPRLLAYLDKLDAIEERMAKAKAQAIEGEYREVSALPESGDEQET